MNALVAGLDASKAADILWTVLSPDAFHLLVDEREWTADDFQHWATTTLVATLVTRPRRRAAGQG